jgi:hypothetical protein
MHDNFEAFFIFLDGCQRPTGMRTIRRRWCALVGWGVLLHSLFLLYGCHW